MNKTKNIKKAGRTIKVNGLLDKIQLVTDLVDKNLGKYVDKYEVLRDEKSIAEYIDKCIENGEVAIDTETDGLDTMTCNIAGICLYTPGQKAVYIPINHINYITQARIENQVTEEFIKSQLQKLKNIKTIFFNAKFDIKMIKNTIGIDIVPFWDCYIGARLLNENEPENNLKALHRKYCNIEEQEIFKFEDLFKGVPFTQVPINTGFIYAARDAEITYELFKFQEPFLTENHETCINKGLEGVAFVFNHIEMPLISVVAEMENTGIAIDFEYAKKLSVKYNEKLKEIQNRFILECEKYKLDIENYQNRTVNSKLTLPINIASPAQIAILLYDILAITPPDITKSRGTGEDILSKMDNEIAKIILEYRGIAKLLTTYIDKLPKVANIKTGRIHASFNQMGTYTGRFSSSNPNLQNIPSHNTEIRQLFIASPGNVLLSSDYSAQEPRLTAHMSNDLKMIEAFRNGKDLYAEMASLAFNKDYEDCKEFRKDGSLNKEGKERRNQAKAIFLGICYGKGVRAIGEDLKISTQKAQEIYDSVLKEFDGLKRFMIESEQLAREKGYVTTFWGRKRRLPNMQLEPYEIQYPPGFDRDFDPLDFDTTIEKQDVDINLKNKYLYQLNNCRSWKDRLTIINSARKEGINIKDNGGYIAEATRQCVNSRIQGSAADQSKLAMLLVANDSRLKELNFKLLLAVHDELIGECPEEHLKEVSERFAELMIKAAEELSVPSKCDVEISRRWYGESIEIK